MRCRGTWSGRASCWTGSWRRRSRKRGRHAERRKVGPATSELRTGTRCGHEGLTAACPTCTTEGEHRRDVAGMTPEERLEEFRSWGDVLEIDFAKVHKRIEELVGRPVWTHELGTS